MTPITFGGFNGSNQAIDPRLLPEGVCTFMENAYPGLGDLRPLKQHLTVASVPASPQRQTIWRMGRNAVNDAIYWLAWSNVVSVTLGFGGDSNTERTFYTGDGSPKWTNNSIGLSGGPPYPQAARELAMPAPSSAPTVTMNVDGTGTESTVFYVETFVNDIGWESAPSPPSAGLVAKPGFTANITALATPPSGNYGFTARRIYRTQPGTGSEADFYFLREIPIASTSTADDARKLGDLLPTEGFLPPPADAFAIIALWNSMFAMLSGDGKLLLVSEAGHVYAYPLRYQKELKHRGVATAKWAQNLLVLTTGDPVLFQGQDPGGMQEVPGIVGQACVSARGVVAFPHGAMWPSSEGLAYFGDSERGLLTEGIVTPDQWKAMNPSSMVAGRWGKFYVCSYDSGGGVLKGFMFDPLNRAGGIVYLSEGFNACNYDEISDRLYVLQGANVRRFCGGAGNMTATATSKQFLQTKPTLYGAAKVAANGFPLTLQVYANGALRATRSVMSRAAFNLPRGYTAEDWQLKITTTHNVQAGRLAADVPALRGV